MAPSPLDEFPSSLRHDLEERPTISNDDNENILVIGIDFGTTFSGVAWATAADFVNDNINIITSWPKNGPEEGKVPTEMYYEQDGSILWGSLVEPDCDPVRWFKLLLVHEEDLDPDLKSSEFIHKARKFLAEEGKTAVDLVADYLRALWDHALETIKRAIGEALLKALRFNVVITVPAIWKEYARGYMEQAARDAGILNERLAGDTTLKFVPEPEAAGLSTLSDVTRKVSKDDVFVICDAGGGTVDLITYKVSNTKPISLEEAVEGKGALCGGIFVDQAFAIKCKKCLGKRWERLSGYDKNSVMRRDWEKGVKPQFTPSLDKDYDIQVPALAGITDDPKSDPIIKGGRMIFTTAHIESIFSGVFKDIDKLVDDQIESSKERKLSVTGIILVGGFGASPYLYEHLRDRYKANGIDILQASGMKPRTAICRGAVIKGFVAIASEVQSERLNTDSLPIKVTSTISRSSYGTSYKCRFVPGTHEERDKVWSDVEYEYMAENQMDWYLKRGEVVSTKDTVRKSWVRTFRDENDFHGSITEHIQSCDEKVPPSRKTDLIKNEYSIKCDIGIPFSQLTDWVNSEGKKFKRLHYDIEMVPSGATLEFSVYLNERKMGASNVAVKFE
ncbi:hypothetical protein GQX73_g6252 [Xylaria multiplex]|uniref:Actin-like ATPase domain-containing protein n=1 Tax=Xylaria multiplex TaxID=323545 RepID=A0A7C8IMD0_9PEZI|nr:hypothetical protein GQX73_g6252 [Xylaria multiplex]